MTLPTVALSELEFGLVDGLFDDQIDGFGAAKPKCNGGSPCRRSRHYLNRPQGPNHASTLCPNQIVILIGERCPELTRLGHLSIAM